MAPEIELAQQRVAERLQRYRADYPEFAAAVEEATAALEGSDPQAARAFRLSMVAGTREIAALLGLDEAAAAASVSRGAGAVSDRLGTLLEGSGIVSAVAEDVSAHADTRGGAPIPLAAMLRREVRESAWVTVVADAAARMYRRAKERVAGSRAVIEAVPWEAQSYARRAFALHDLREDTFFLRAVAAVTAGRGNAAAQALQKAGRVAWRAVELAPTPERIAGRAKDIDSLARRMHGQKVRTELVAAIRRGLSSRRGAWLARWESSRMAKAVAALSALEAPVGSGIARSKVVRIVQSVPPDLAAAIDEAAGSRGEPKKGYRPLGIFSVDGKVLLAGVAPSYEALIVAGYRKTNNPALLEGADLRGIRLDGLDLSSCAKGASLRNACLDAATLTDCNFAGASFAGASIERARAVGTSFAGASFDKARMRWTLMDGCNFDGAQCGWADEKGLVIIRPVKLEASRGESAAIAGALYCDGIEWKKRGHFVEAASRFEAADSRHPKGRYEYAVALGDVRYGIGDSRAGDAYRRALELLAAGKGVASRFETLFAIGRSADRRGDRVAAQAAYHAALGPEVRRTGRQEYRAARAYGFAADEPSVAIDYLRRAFNFQELGPNDRQLVWKLADLTADAMLASDEARRDPTILSTCTRAVERLSILERGTPVDADRKRLERLQTLTAGIGNEQRTAMPPPVAPPSVDVPPSVPPAVAAPPTRSDHSAGPERDGRAEALVTEAKANLDSFFARQLEHARASGNPGLVARVEEFQTGVREDVVRMERVTQSPVFWTRKAAGGETVALEGWEFAASMCEKAGPRLGDMLARLAPQDGESMGAIRPDASGRLIGPRGEVVADREQEALHSRIVAALRADSATQVFEQAMGESYSRAGRAAIVEALERSGGAFVAENADIAVRALDGDGAMAQIEMIDLVAKSDKQLMGELCRSARKDAAAVARPATAIER